MPSRLRRRAGARRRVEAALRALPPPRGAPRRQRRARPHRTWAASAGSLLAGHLDTVPIADNLPSRRDGERLYGCGTSDMKAGDAVFLHVAATVAEPRHDLTLVFYDCEEVEAARNGLGRVEREPGRLADRGPRAPRRADRRPGRGRMPGHAARRGPHHRAARPLGAVVARRQRRPPRRRGARAARRLRRPPRRDRRLRVPRGPAGRADRRRGRGQRRARRVRRHRQLPVRPRPHRRRGRAARPRGLRRARRDGHRLRRGSAARPRRPGGPGVPRRDRARPRGRSSAGPTWRGSPPSASPR